jgi:hypothetical protein
VKARQPFILHSVGGPAPPEGSEPRQEKEERHPREEGEHHPLIRPEITPEQYWHACQTGQRREKSV